jgi:hypothetical protein
MGNIQFKVFSELYGTTDAVICDMDHAIKFGFAPCGDGCDYRFTEHEFSQLKSGYAKDKFTPSSSLLYPLNLVALMQIKDNTLLLPKTFRFNKDQYSAVKQIMQKAGGLYKKNCFVFKEDALTVYNRIINGEDFNLKKKFNFFATPDSLADYLVKLSNIKKGYKILEPSAGQGAIVNAIVREYPSIYVDVCESMEINQDVLENNSNTHFICPDFLNIPEQYFEYYDTIIANPPFSKNQDIDHITKMYDCLKSGGRLVSIASKHWQTSENKKEKNFTKWLKDNEAEIIEIPAGSFKESGTSVATCIIVINKI